MIRMFAGNPDEGPARTSSFAVASPVPLAPPRDYLAVEKEISFMAASPDIGFR
jgi:hypothetical protein